MLPQNRLADCIDDANKLGLVRGSDFLNDCQAFVELILNRECHGTAWPQSFVTSLHGQLNILGIKISSPDNNEVFEPAGHKKLALVKKAQISGPKKGTVPGIFQKRTEGVVGLFGIIPISLRDMGARDPDLANPSRRATRTRQCVDDYNFLSGWRLPATHDVVGWNVFGRINHHIISLESR